MNNKLSRRRKHRAKLKKFWKKVPQLVVRGKLKSKRYSISNGISRKKIARATNTGKTKKANERRPLLSKVLPKKLSV